ncbi:response regulator [Pendulispora rubella]|uniref:Response regulator n=1 Tax=Pendulispora rubella TaxID=2741070 RepID=A0ABZ2KY89_9BACT
MSPTAPLLLIVDDSQDNREMYVEYLSSYGYRIAEAENGQAALDVAFEVSPSLVVMDLTLPIIDGWEATRRLRADPRTASVPIIALTGHTHDRHARSAREAGCNSFLLKPCLPEDLLREVQRLLPDYIGEPEDLSVIRESMANLRSGG